MRSSLIIVGVFFLVIGGLLYFLPMQEFKAKTTTIESGEVDSRTSSARVSVPQGFAFASALVGIVLLLLGLVIPDQRTRSVSRSDSYEQVADSTEDVGIGKKRKIVKKQTIVHDN